jgi:translation initiation factor 3 subunit B
MSSKAVDDALADEAEGLDGYFSDAPLNPTPKYPALDASFDNCIVITNLPQVPEAKLDKLTKVVLKLVTKIGTVRAVESESFDGVFMPLDPTKDRSLGFCMVEYETPEQARNAVDVLQGYKFDKNHALRTTLYSRAKALQGVTAQEFKEPPPPPFEQKPDATEWLQDSLQRDEYVIRYGKETAVLWWDSKNDPIVDYDGEREKEAGLQWCEYYCHWSPAGSYLATLVPARGVILWSGANYEKSGRLVAPGVKQVLFSPQENYILTNNENPNDAAAIKVYHVPTGNLLRAFPLYPDKVSRDGPPPPFLWSHDDQYLARMGDGLISIFETPSMRLLDKKSLLADGVCEFQWSPKANILACWVRIALITRPIVATAPSSQRNSLRLETGAGGEQLPRSRGSYRDPVSEEAATEEPVQCHPLQHGVPPPGRLLRRQGYETHEDQEDSL